MNKILLIEDQEELRELIVYNLEKGNDFAVVEAGNANDALILLDDINIDLILLDLMLPGLNGFDFLRIVKRNDHTSAIPVIVISAKTQEEDVILGLRSGADDYVTKPFKIKELMARIETVLRRSGTAKQTAFSCSGITIDTQARNVLVDDEVVALTNKEFELLLLFMRNPHQVFHRNTLLNTIWGYDPNVYTRTVDTHISSLRKKLGHHGGVIRSIPKIGYGLTL